MVGLLSSLRFYDNIVEMDDAGPGFTLPENIGDLDPAVEELDLSSFNLTGISIATRAIYPV